ncbi:hypothetical protein AC249_AIPGENE11530 [Exaiptasia diaphana]|nr:hypothetical protein AC249_AIPGENE11530 [Exaiptasia diaphana]
MVNMLFLLLFITQAYLIQLVYVKGNDYPSNCSAIGTKKVSILWKIQTVNNSLNYSYSVFFRKNKSTFSLGCTVNSSRSLINECDIGKALKLNFPKEYSFIYYIRTDNGLTQQEGPHKECKVNMIMKCTDPTGLAIEASSKRTLKLKWHPLSDMGEYVALCYRIIYAIYKDDRSKKVENDLDLEGFSYSIKTLLPYTKYAMWLQCALECSKENYSMWSNVVGPVVARTLEEIPQGKVKFLQLEEKQQKSTRKIIIHFELPLKEMWNGNITHVQIYCFKGSTLCHKKKVPPSQQVISFDHLKADVVYNLQAEYCNNEGCSNRSYYNVTFDNGIQKRREMRSKTSSNKDPHKTLKIVLPAVIGVITIIVIIIGIIIACRRNNPNQMSLQEQLGDLEAPRSDSEEDNETIDPVNSEYASVGANSRLTLHPDTTDFRSASGRSLHSFSCISLAEQSSVHDASIEPPLLDHGENIELVEITTT